MKINLLIILIIVGLCQCHTTFVRKVQIGSPGGTVVSISYITYDSLVRKSPQNDLAHPQGGRLYFMIMAETKSNANRKHYTYQVEDSLGGIITTKTGKPKIAQRKIDLKGIWQNFDSMDIKQKVTRPFYIVTTNLKTKDTKRSIIRIQN